MIKRIMACIVLVAPLLLSGCGDVVDPGHVGVYVKNPYTFGEQGVDMEYYPEGRYYSWPSSYLIQYKIQPIQEEEVFNDISTKNKTPVDFKAIIRYKVIPEKAPILHQNFGLKFYDDNIKKDFQNMLRDFAREHDITQLTTDKSVTGKGEDEILKNITALVEEKGVPIHIMAVTIGAIIPPEDVLAETSRTEAQNQRASTESSRAAAETARKMAETKKAEADKAYMEEMKMTPTEYLQSRQIEINREIIETIKKKENVNIIFSMGGAQTNTSVTQPLK